jgi:amino-acid N-acetyltransferase
VSHPDNPEQFVSWFRHSSPYIHAFRGRLFVIAFGGETVADPAFPNLIQDIALLNSLGVKLVLVHGARPQIEQRLRQRGASIEYVNGRRLTDDVALSCVKDAVGSVRVEIEALLSMGVANSPMHGAKVRVTSGNFVTARPLGIHEGVDYMHTGEVRRVDVRAIESQLRDNDIVLLAPLGYSPTGEVFNLTSEDVATSTAVQLQADKLIFLSDEKGPTDGKRQLLRQLTVSGAEDWLAKKKTVSEELERHMRSSIHACRHGVQRVHLLDRRIDGGLLLELFTRDGIGSLITDDLYEGTRQANIDDVGGILELIAPYEEDGSLVRRSRERLETEIKYFTVVERDGMIIACAALYPGEKQDMAELACLAVHPDYRNAGRGDELLACIEQQAKQAGVTQLFVLSTRTMHWFRERGFRSADIKTLPGKRRSLYNYQRNSRIFLKALN